jgi:hypothetical protein
MMYRLDTIFGELGISQYLNAFIDQGFDSWETILDITESDLWEPPERLLVLSSSYTNWMDWIETRLV